MPYYILMNTICTVGVEETMNVAEEFSKRFRGGEIIALNGALGAGKTVFVQGFARGLGIERHVLSPTFNIVREYFGRLRLNHFDVYRLCDSEELYEIGFEEYISNGGVTIIEWASKVVDMLPKDVINITMIREDEFLRRIIFDGAPK